MVLVFYIDYAPAILAAPDLTPVDDNGIFGADNGEGYEVFDAAVHGTLFLILLLVVVRVHTEVVKSELFLDPLLEGHALVKGKGVGLGDDGNNVDDVGEFLEYYDIDGFEPADG